MDVIAITKGGGHQVSRPESSMSAKRMITWCWREIVSVIVIGAVGMALFELAWFAVGLGQAPRSFLLLAGVAMCTWLHPRVCRRRLSSAHA